MKRWIAWVFLLGCLLFLYQPTQGQAVLVWTEKGCNAHYAPGDVVKIHYRIYEAGWTRVYKQYPDTHEEELAGWRYFARGGEFVEIDTLGPQCGTITYTVTFWQQIPLYSGCVPCNACSPFPVYAMEKTKNMCSIDVVCDIDASLSTDKTEYTAGVDTEAELILNVTDSYGTSIDADSVIIDVNGQELTPLKTSNGFYRAFFTLSNRNQGEYTATAHVLKRGHLELHRSTQFVLVIPVSVRVSTDDLRYTQHSQATIRAEVKDYAGGGVTGLRFGCSVSEVEVPFSDLGGGIYEAQLDLRGFAQGQYIVHIDNLEKYVQVQSVRTAEFAVVGLPEIVIELPHQVKIEKNSAKEISILVKNKGEGEAVHMKVQVTATPGISVLRVTGYSSGLSAGDETAALLSLQGRESGLHTLELTVLYQDIGRREITVSRSLPITVTSQTRYLYLYAAVTVAIAIGAGAYLFKNRRSTKSEASTKVDLHAGVEDSKKAEQPREVAHRSPSASDEAFQKKEGGES